MPPVHRAVPLVRGAAVAMILLIWATACGGDNPVPVNRQPDVVQPDPPLRWTVAARDMSTSSLRFQGADETSLLITDSKGAPTLVDIATGVPRWTGTPVATEPVCALSAARVACATGGSSRTRPAIAFYDAGTGKITGTTALPAGSLTGSLVDAGNGWLVKTFGTGAASDTYTLVNLDGSVRWRKSGYIEAQVRIPSGLATFRSARTEDRSDPHTVIRLSDGRPVAGPAPRVQALPTGIAGGGDRVTLSDPAGTVRGSLPAGWDLPVSTWASWPQALPPQDCPDVIGVRRSSGKYTEVGVFDAATGALRWRHPYTGDRSPNCVEGGVLLISDARDGYTRIEVLDRATAATRFATEIRFAAGPPRAAAQSGTVLTIESLRFNKGQADGLTVFTYGIDRGTGSALWRTSDDVSAAGGYLFAVGPQRTYISLIDTRRQRDDV